MKYFQTLLIRFLISFIAGLILFQDSFKSLLLCFVTVGSSLIIQLSGKTEKLLYQILLVAAFSIIISLLVLWHSHQLSQTMKTLLFFLIYYSGGILLEKRFGSTDESQ